MILEAQLQFRNNPKFFDYLKANSYYFKELDRGNIDYKRFINDMKIKYQERATDKISKAIDNINLISQVIDVLK